MATVDKIKAFIDSSRAAGATKFNAIINTNSIGCDKLLKGRGVNSFKTLFNIDLDTITKVSSYEIMLGDINYQKIKESNGNCSKVNAKTGEYEWVKGYEGVLAMNKKTGVYQLRYFIDPKAHKHIVTVYMNTDGTVFNPYAPEYKDFRKETRIVEEDHKDDVMIRYICIDKINNIQLI